MEQKDLIKIFKSLSDDNRLRILELLKDGEKCACKLLEELKITQPTLSHHMKILTEASIVNSRKDGKWMYYSINMYIIKFVKKYFSEYEK